MTNPNPALITNEMWQFWLDFKALEPSVLLGGIYANKSGYHNTRDENEAHFPGDYSYSEYALDRQGPGDKAAAIDFTFPDAQAGDYKTIAKYSARLLVSGRDLNDERGNYLREFYGNADLDREVEGWDFQRVGPASSDDSHLWHIHLSFMRAYVTDPKAFRAIMSILKGETVAMWRTHEGISTPTPPPPPTGPRLRRSWPSYMPANHYFGLKSGPEASHGGFYPNEVPDVKAIQQRLTNIGYRPGPIDGDFGPLTRDGVIRWQRAKYSAYTTRYGEVWKDDWTRLFTY